MKETTLKNFPFIFMLLMIAHAGYTQKTDKVRLKNGDVITGEILSMRLAMLTYKMDGPGTINVKWEEVVGFKSDKVFEVTLRWGTIVTTRVDSNFYVTYHATVDDIIELVPIKDKILRRLRGDFNLGFNYSKSSGVLQFNLYTDVHYKIPIWDFSITVNSVVTSQKSDTTTTKKQDVTFSVLKDLKNKWFVGAYLGWQQNTELGLNNRILLTGVIAQTPISDNHNRLILSAGLSTNMEQSIQSVTYSTNLDGVVMVGYKRFYYNTPKLSIDALAAFYPGLSDWGRIRMDDNLSVSVEIFKDFSIGLNVYYTYDSKPPAGALSTNDYGFNFTIGYFFGK